MASIHQTKFKTYEVRYRKDGIMRSKSFKRKETARQFCAKVELKEKEVIPPVAPPPASEKEPVMTFAEFAELWLKDHAEVHKTPSSVIRDRQILRDHVNPALGKVRLDEIDKRRVVNFQSRLRQQTKLSNKTINNIVSTVQKMVSDAVLWDLLPANPIKGIRRLKVPEVKYNFWSESERDRFLDYTRSRDPKLHDVVAFTVLTGLRRGEVQGLLRDCIDLETKQITVKRNYCSQTNRLNEHTKGKTIRMVPMNPVVYAILREKRFLTPNQPVFQFDFNNLVQRRFRPAQKAAGVNPISFHDLRHTFASHMIMKGATVFEVKKLLGHSDIATTMRYSHLAPGQLNGITDRLVSGCNRHADGTIFSDVRDLFGVKQVN